MMSDTCGPTSALPLMRFDLASSSWRTCEATSLWDLEMSSPTFPEWGMTRNGELFEQPMPERPTVGRESSSLLRTPHMGLGERGRDGVYANPKGQQDLQHQIATDLLPTPAHQNGNGHGASLTQEAISLLGHGLTLTDAAWEWNGVNTARPSEDGNRSLADPHQSQLFPATTADQD